MAGWAYSKVAHVSSSYDKGHGYGGVEKVMGVHN